MWYSKEYNPIQAGSIDGTDTEPHDAAVQRAAISHYRPPKHLPTDPHCTLFISRLSFDTTETTIRSHFKKYGEISDLVLIRNYVTGLSQGYAFLTFTSQKSAKDAYRDANKSILDSHTILVDFERSRVMKDWVPRRLGGGFGGKKESGQLRFGARDRPFREPPATSRLHISHEQKRSDCWIHSVSKEPRARSSSVARQRYRSPRRELEDRRSSRPGEEKRPRHRYRSRSPTTDHHWRRSRSPSVDRHRRSSSGNRHRSSRHHHQDSSSQRLTRQR